MRLSIARGLAREQVRSLARVFHFGIGIALDYLHCHEPRPDQLARHDLWSEEYEVERYGTTEELINVNRALSYVEG
jgi:hypothetical protein